MATTLTIPKLIGLAALTLPVLLAGCGGSMGSAGLQLLSGGERAEESAAPAQAESVALAPEETPPVPTRRPGKRPPATAGKTPEQAVAASAGSENAQAAAQKEEGFTLASLGKGLLAGEPVGPDSVLMEESPVAAYTLLAQRIKNCWLKPGQTKLTNHGFHAEVAPGEAREAKIVVYEKAADGRQGVSAFRIDITAQSSGSLVSSRNARLDPALESGFKADLARWAKGDDRCKG